MRAWQGSAALAAIAFALLAAVSPAAAVARPGIPATASIELRGSHGYKVDAHVVSGSSILSATKSARRAGLALNATDYTVFGGHATRDRVRLDLGRRGRIDARFVPSGKVRRSRNPHCSGGPALLRFGSFVGTLRFRGENGYTEVAARHAPGTVFTRPHQVCHFPKRKHRHRNPEKKRSRGPRVTTFTASSPRFSFSAQESPLGTDATFIASASQARGRLFITRFAAVDSPSADFSFDAKLDSATISPPWPFAGSGRFERIDNHASRWEGPLTVSFPGLAAVPLTGRSFAWSLTSRRLTSSSVGFSLYSIAARQLRAAGSRRL